MLVLFVVIRQKCLLLEVSYPSDENLYSDCDIRGVPSLLQESEAPSHGGERSPSSDEETHYLAAVGCDCEGQSVGRQTTHRLERSTLAQQFGNFHSIIPRTDHCQELLVPLLRVLHFLQRKITGFM